MRVLLVGVGGVGEAIAVMAKSSSWLELMVLADYSLDRAKEVQARVGTARFPVESVDASDPAAIAALARKHKTALIMNACAPQYNQAIFDAALEVKNTYIDMAATLSTPHPTKPFTDTHIKLGDYQFAKAKQWEAAGCLALVGMGVEPGMVDVFARYASEELFDSVEEYGVRDGSNLTIKGYEFAPNFSIWTTIEECLNPPVIYEDGRWFTTEPFSQPEVFDFPGGIGPQEVINVEHEEVLLIPRYLPSRRVTFKYALGNQFISVLQTLHSLGLDSTKPVDVKGKLVSPRDVVAAVLPNPAKLGHLMEGKTCAGLWVKGVKGGKPRQVYLYQVADNKECMERYGCQAVVAQTAFNALLAMELLATGLWKATGVHGPEVFPPKPFLDRMAAVGFPWGHKEMSGAGSKL